MKPKERIPDAIYERGYVYNFHFHLIWVTKYRNPAFTTPELVQEMKDILLRIAQLNDVTVEELEVMPEHVHMLISFKPKYTPADWSIKMRPGIFSLQSGAEWPQR